MGFGDTSLLCKIVFILMILCFLSDLLGFAIPYWYAKEYTSFNLKYNGGLWVYCIEFSSTSFGYKTCDNYNAITLPGWFKAVQAFSILSWLFFLAALVLVILFVFFQSDNKMLYLGTVCLSFVGAFCALVAFAVYAGKAREFSTNYDVYSGAFALTVIAFILGLINGILGIIDYLGVVGGKVWHNEQ